MIVELLLVWMSAGSVKMLRSTITGLVLTVCPPFPESGEDGSFLLQAPAASNANPKIRYLIFIVTSLSEIL
jgi:hypothetical protein